MGLRSRLLSMAGFALTALTAAWTVGQAPAQPVDPVRQAVRDCRNRSVAQARLCYENVLLARLRADGAGPALDLLARIAEIDDGVRRDGHMYAHGIGIAALESPDQVGRVFASCTPAWQSGCYHGVIQSYFLATRRAGSEITTASVDALCADYRDRRRNSRLHFQCSHGLGHGLTMFHGHDLRLALASCDLLSRQSESEACYGGAFMENIVNVTHPHHAAGGDAHEAGGNGHDAHAQHAQPAGHGAHGHHGHDAAQASAAEPWRALDPDDLHYPCSAVDARYQEACYTIQTAAMLYHTGHDLSRTARACEGAPAQVRRTCFVSLGRDVSSIAGPRIDEAVRLCGVAAAEFQPACHEGVVKALINMNADPADGLPYCRAIGSAASKTACYEIVGREADREGDARRRRACRGAEEAYVDACLGHRATMAPATVTARSSRR